MRCWCRTSKQFLIPPSKSFCRLQRPRSKKKRVAVAVLFCKRSRSIARKRVGGSQHICIVVGIAMNGAAQIRSALLSSNERTLGRCLCCNCPSLEQIGELHWSQCTALQAFFTLSILYAVSTNFDVLREGFTVWILVGHVSTRPQQNRFAQACNIWMSK